MVEDQIRLAKLWVWRNVGMWSGLGSSISPVGNHQPWELDGWDPWPQERGWLDPHPQGSGWWIHGHTHIQAASQQIPNALANKSVGRCRGHSMLSTGRATLGVLAGCTGWTGCFLQSNVPIWALPVSSPGQGRWVIWNPIFTPSLLPPDCRQGFVHLFLCVLLQLVQLLPDIRIKI